MPLDAGTGHLYSKEAGNDLPNFAEVIWDHDTSDPCRLPEARVKEFTISSTFSSLIETIANLRSSAARWTES